MRVFVTGASGFVGSYVVRRLVAESTHDVAVLMRSSTDAWRLNGLLGQVHRIAGDLDDLAAAEHEIRAFAPEAVVHLAWFGVENTYRNDPRQVRNISTGVGLVELTRRVGAAHWIGIGSQAEYGPRDEPIGEEVPTRPTSLYGVTKLSTGLLADHLCAAAGVRFAWLRAFSIYGPRDHPSWMIPHVIGKLLRGERPALTAGEQLWDYLYVEDAADAICRIVMTPGAEGFFNLGSGRSQTIREIVERLRDRIDRRLPLGFGDVPYRSDQVMRLEADITRLRKVTGWTPLVDLDEGLAHTIEWFREDLSAMIGDLHDRPCRLCGLRMKLLLAQERVPTTVQTLFDAQSPQRDQWASLTLCRCNHCGLVQLSEDPSPTQLYSSDYCYSVNFSDHAREYQQHLADRWSSVLGSNRRSVLEVGGGDGFFAELLSQRGCSVTLIDPAPLACRAARERPLERVVEGYLAPETFRGERFDAVVARHVLEHVNRPLAFLELLRSYLVEPGGVLFVEVPNLDGIVARGRFQDFYTEHLAYFEPQTLTRALATAGFEVLEVYTIEGGDYLVGVARVPETRLEEMLADLGGFVTRFRDLAALSRARGRRLAVWGAGGRCVSLLALVGAQELGIAYVVDSDAKKWGRFLPGSHLPVVPPEALRIDPVDDVLIAATAFQDEILRHLQWFRDGGGRVGLIQPEPHWIGEPKGEAHEP